MSKITTLMIATMIAASVAPAFAAGPSTSTTTAPAVTSAKSAKPAVVKKANKKIKSLKKAPVAKTTEKAAK